MYLFKHGGAKLTTSDVLDGAAGVIERYGGSSASAIYLVARDINVPYETACSASVSFLKFIGCQRIDKFDASHSKDEVIAALRACAAAERAKDQNE
jgi:hypothetical protein